MKLPNNPRIDIFPILLALFSGFIVVFPLTDTDIWWHLASARQMLATGSFLYADPFAYTPTASRWIDLHWLYQLISYGIYSCGKVYGLILFKAIMVSITTIILFYALPVKKYSAIAVLIFSVMLYQSRFLLDYRPMVITLFCISVYLFLIEQFCKTARYRFLVLLFPVQILWANSQGLFVLGPVIACVYWVGEVVNFYLSKKMPTVFVSTGGVNLKKSLPFLLFAFGLCCVNCINPYGIEALAFPLQLLHRIDPSVHNVFSTEISENISFVRLIVQNPAQALFVIITGVITLGLILLQYRTVRVAHLLLTICFLVLACMAQRNIVVYAFVVMPILAFWAIALIDSVRLSQRSIRRLDVGSGFAAVVVIGCFSFSHAKVLAIHGTSDFIAPFSVPTGAVQYLKAHPVEDGIFNADRFGGYLLWELFPPKKVFIDDRLILRTPQFFAQYLLALDDPATFKKTCAEYSITHVILQTAVFDRYMKLTQSLYGDSAWSLVYADGVAALFVKKELAQTSGLVLESSTTIDSLTEVFYRLYTKKSEHDERMIYWGVFLMNMKAYASAQTVFAQIPGTLGTQYSLRCRYLEQNPF